MKTLTILAATALAALAAPAAAHAAASPIPVRQTVEPGAVVLAADGSELGRLEGSRTSADGVAQVVVRDADGQRRAIPTTAVTLHGDELRAMWTADQFWSAPVLVPAAGVAAVGTSGNRGPRGDASQLRSSTRLGEGPGGTLIEDPTRRTEVQQQQAPGENPR